MLSHVLNSGLGEMLVDMMESMLRDIAHSQSRMFGHSTLLRDRLAGEKFDQGRFACTVGTDDTDTGR